MTPPKNDAFDSPPKDIDPFTSLQDRLHEELKQRMSNLNVTTAKKVHSPVLYVTPTSSAEEVQFWLTAKGFGARTQQKLQNVKGESLFVLEKTEMERDLGLEEGMRLFNLITIQKNICGFKTMRSKELTSVLEARRKKIDPDDDYDDRRFSEASSIERKDSFMY